MRKKIVKNIIIALAVILVVLAAWWFFKCQCVNLNGLTPAAFRDYLRGFGRWAPVIFISAYALDTVLMVPPIGALSLAAGLAFGRFWGAVILMAGAMLGTSITFFISRLSGRALFERIIKGKLKNLDELLEKKGFVTILFFRIIPLVPYEALNYASGISKIKFKDYFLATFLGLIPGVIISAFFGGSLGEIGSFKDIFAPKFLIAAGLLIVIIAIPAVYKAIKKRPGEKN
ncbi:MAG: TVP38/TMEM64 family protein [Candidatus Omnitrophica bacterium]|nr:TVP38/TMEM64 family protein [Candidatus Omnitrophota bacterium]